jgi:hypothetical protein
MFNPVLLKQLGDQRQCEIRAGATALRPPARPRLRLNERLGWSLIGLGAFLVGGPAARPHRSLVPRPR